MALSTSECQQPYLRAVVGVKERYADRVESSTAALRLRAPGIEVDVDPVHGGRVCGLRVDGWDLLVHFAALGLGATVVNGCVAVPSRLRTIPITDLPAVRYWAAWRPQRTTALAAVLGHL